MLPGPTLTAFLAEATSPSGADINSGGPAGHPSGTAARPGDAAARGAEHHADTSSPPGLATCGDEALIGIIRGWRKIASLAAGCELAAVAELAGRRYAQAKEAGEWDSTAIDGAGDEIAAALTLTGRSAELLLDRAAALRELPATAAALRAGRIDMPKALVLITGLGAQEPDLARVIEAQLMDRAPALTTGQLRAALNRALIAADPDAAERRRQDEERQARIERAPEMGGVTATLNGRYLPVPATVAAWNHITTVARQLRDAGAEGTLDQLRVHVYLALLSGRATAPPGLAGLGAARNNGAGAASEGAPGGAIDDGPAKDDSATAGTGSEASVPGRQDRVLAAIERPGGLTGTVNLTAPMTTVLGLTEEPGELGGFGPITAHTVRDLAASALRSSGVRWCITITDDNGLPTGHGCATRVRAVKSDTGSSGSSGWTFTFRLSTLAVSECSHQRQSSHYRPPSSLSHLIQIRNPTCTGPGCRMPAVKCDDDHTIAYGRGGRTCECNIGPLCRHHHRVKQSQGWRLVQPEPGVFAWSTPSGWTYFTGPESRTA